MKTIYLTVFFLIIGCYSMFLKAQNNYQEYYLEQDSLRKEYQKRERHNFQEYSIKQDSLFKEFCLEEKSRYKNYLPDIEISNDIKRKIDHVESLYPKELNIIPLTTSLKDLGLNRNNLLIESGNTSYFTQKDFQTTSNIEKESIATNNTIVPNILKDKTIDKEIKFEIEANRPIFCPLAQDSYRMSSPFGNRIHPIFGKKKFHEGIDLASKQGTEIYSTATGVVIVAKESKFGGNTIIIDHQNGYTTTYMHLNKILVKKNQKVVLGQVIGEVGSTGILSTRSHLHYEIRKNGDAFDPESFIVKHLN